jgi:hypothetical protein
VSAVGRSVEILDGAVRIRYSGLDRGIAGLSELVLPFQEIAGVDVGLADAPSPWTLRRIGLADPFTRRRRGRFWRDGRRLFLDLRDPSRALVLRLRGHPHFDVVALEHDDAERLAEEIDGRRLVRSGDA